VLAVDDLAACIFRTPAPTNHGRSCSNNKDTHVNIVLNATICRPTVAKDAIGYFR